MTIAASRRPATRNPRTKLGDALAQNLAKDFTEHGAGAIAKMRQDKPLDYMKLTSTRSCWRSKSHRKRQAMWRPGSKRSTRAEPAVEPILLKHKRRKMSLYAHPNAQPRYDHVRPQPIPHTWR